VSAFVNFVQSALAPFQFQPTLNGVQYNVTVPSNAFGERYYINVSDLSGNLILYRALTESGPSFQASLTWAKAVVTAALTSNHNVRMGELANLRISQSNSPFDGTYQGLAVNATTFTFALPADPNVQVPVRGTLDFPLDLLAGYGIGSLFFHFETQQFEF
jgi:hypothetical protein